MTQQPKRLLHQMRDPVQLMHYANSTAQSYPHCAKRFVVYRRNRHPLEMREQITESTTHLPVAQNVAALTQDRALSATRHVCSQLVIRREAW